MSDKIRHLQNCAGSSYIRDLLAGSSDEPLYMLKPEILPILKWVNEKILFELPKIKTTPNKDWVEVRLRIATGMLNKHENILTKNICIEYHTRLISNVRKIIYEIAIEDLPFLESDPSRYEFNFTDSTKNEVL